MEAVFDLASRQPLVIGATGMEAIIQNIRMILMTLRFSIPLDRGFAHDGRMIDAPAPQDAWRKTRELIDAIEKYEPRVRVEKIEFVYHDIENQLQEGTLTPKVTFSLKKGVCP